MKEISFEFDGIPLTVTGEWVPFVPARITADPYYSEPAEGGYLEDYCVYVEDVDITDIIDFTMEKKIIEKAEEEIGGVSRK